MRLLDSLVAAVLPKGSGHWRCTAVSIGLTFMLAAAAFAGSLPLRHAWAHFGQEWRRGDAADPTFASLGPAPGDKAEGRLVLQGLWEWLTHDLGAVTGHAAFPGIVSLAFYAVYCLPYFVLDCLDLPALRPYKHRGAERPVSGASAWGHTTRHTLWMFVCFILPGVCWQVATRGPWLYANGPDYCVVWCDGKDLFPRLAPTLLELAVQTLTCLFVFDFLYYNWHSQHHRNRDLYRQIHSVHHEYHAPFVWVTMYEHPAELFHVSLLSLVVPIALGTHPLTQWLWLIVSVALSVDAHAGYDLPIHQMLLAVLPFSNRWIKGGLGSSEHHDLHHQWPRTNFQPFFTYADLLFGTSFEQSSFNKKNRKERPAAKLPATTFDAGDGPSSDAMEAAAAAVTEG